MGAGVAIPVAVHHRSTREQIEWKYKGGPYPTPRYYGGAWRDPETDLPLAEDDPRFDMSKDWAAIKALHDKMLKEGAFAPPTFPGQGSLQPPTPRRK